MSPIMILDFKRLKELLANKETDDEIFCHLHNYIANYMYLNIMVKG